jgi:hypothetical protein
MGAPMPHALRSVVRAHQHEACRVPCDHCGAHQWQPCTTPSKRHRLEIPHASRITAAATVVATPGVVSLAEYREAKEAGDAAQAR